MLHHDKNNKGRLGILAQREAGFEPSPAFVMLTGVRKRLLPLTKREGCDSVISSDFKSKISITNENNLSCKDLSYFGRSALLCRQGRELSALVPQYLSNFSDTVFSRFTSHFSHKRIAFTLAEVLITLGIIGVVAAMTLPSLIQKYKEKQTISQVLQAVSLFSQAFTNIATECDGLSNCNNLCSMDVLNYTLPPLLKQNLKIIKICKAGEHSNCIGDIKYKTLNGQAISSEVYGRYDMSGVLNNGMIFVLALPNGGWAYKDNWDLRIDLNGQKSPNTLGKDLFVFFVSDRGIVRARGNWDAASCEIAKSNINNRNGFRCSQWILKYHNMDYLHTNYPNWSDKWN